MYKVNGELCSCDITDCGRVQSREGDIQNFAWLVLLNELISKFAQHFTVGFLNLLSAHQIHIVVWGNFPFNDWTECSLGTWYRPSTSEIDCARLTQAGSSLQITSLHFIMKLRACPPQVPWPERHAMSSLGIWIKTPPQNAADLRDWTT